MSDLNPTLPSKDQNLPEDTANNSNSRLQTLQNLRFFILAGIIILPVLFYIASQFGAVVDLVGIILLLLIFLVSVFNFRLGLFSLILFLVLEPLILKIIPDYFVLYFRLIPEVIIVALFFAGLFSYFSKIKNGTQNFKGFKDPIIIPILLLFAFSIISSLINLVEPISALVGLRQIFRFILLYQAIVLYGLANSQIIAVLVLTSLIAGFESIVGLLQAVIGERADTFLGTGEQVFAGDVRISQDIIQVRESGRRVFATMGRYDQLGTFLALVGSVALGFVYQAGGKIKQIALALLVVLVPALVLTYSRASWFGFLLALIAIAVLIKRDRKVFVILLVVFVSIVGYTISREVQVRRLVDNPEVTPLTRLLEAFSQKRWKAEYRDKGRIYFLAETPKALWPSHIIFGVGPGQYGGGAVALLHNTSAYDKLNLPFGIYSTEGMVDSNWMSILGELGILGFLAFASIFILLLIHSYKILKDERSGWLSKSLALGLIGATISFAFQGWLGTNFEIRTLAPFYWLLAGLTIISYRNENITNKQI